MLGLDVGRDSREKGGDRQMSQGSTINQAGNIWHKFLRGGSYFITVIEDMHIYLYNVWDGSEKFWEKGCDSCDHTKMSCGQRILSLIAFSGGFQMGPFI